MEVKEGPAHKNSQAGMVDSFILFVYNKLSI